MTATESPVLNIEIVEAPVLPQRSLSPHIATIAGFAAVLMLLFVGTFVREQPPFEENRPRNPYPPIGLQRHELQDFPPWFDLALSDRFGYRDWLLEADRRFGYTVLNESRGPLGWIGRDGWLFLDVADPNRGHVEKPSLDERLESWAVALCERRDWLRDRGIEYVVLLPPEKSSVYPEFLTEKQKRSLPASEPPSLLAAKLKTRGVRCIDPRSAFMEEKAKNPDFELYHRFDTHWTQDGALLAVRQLRNELGLTELSKEEFSPSTELREGDLGRTVGQPMAERSRRTTVYVPKAIFDTDADPAFASLLPASAKPKHLPPRTFECRTAPGPRTVLLHDSFAEAMQPFLNVTFRRLSTAASDDLERAMIEAERPSLVVQELVARKLYMTAPRK